MTIALIERFRDRLPVTAATPIVSLGEGSTPLLAAPRLARAIGLSELWLKWEASNPTGSYKDRGMTVAVSKAVEEGAAAVLCASTGNTAASAAAYAARAGLPAVVLTPQGAVAGAKLAQTRMLGATVLEVEGDFDQALAAAQELADRGSHVLVNSLNPHRRAGQKTAVLEIVEELGAPPDVFVLPYGGGGNTVSYAAALAELGLETPLVSVEAAERRRTLGSAIRIGEPVHADAVRRDRRPHRLGLRRGARRCLAQARGRGGALLRALVGGRRCRAASAATSRATASSSRSPGTASRIPIAADRFAPALVAVAPDADAIAAAVAS